MLIIEFDQVPEIEGVLFDINGNNCSSSPSQKDVKFKKVGIAFGETIIVITEIELSHPVILLTPDT